jgi:tripartite-type tricarboxylate transporter receptor subunit TctC
MALRRLMGFVFLSTLAWAAAFAQTYPAKPVRLIVAWAAGGTTDVAARIVAQKVSEGWPHQMVVENRPGAGGTIGAGVAAKASADGYTLLLGSSTEMVVSPHVYKNVSYSTVKDLVPVAYAGAQPMVLVVNPQVPAKSVRELIAYAKTRPNTLNSASAGNGSTLHLGQVLFESLTGVKFVHVPYAGSPQAAMGTVSGDAQVHFGSLSAVQELVRTGKLRGLATTGARRAGSMADLPTLVEAGVPGYDLIIWNALFAPQGTPPEIINRVHTDVNRALAGKEAQDAFAKLSMDYSPMSGNDLSAMVSTDWSRLGKIVQSAGLKVD